MYTKLVIGTSKDNAVQPLKWLHYKKMTMNFQNFAIVIKQYQLELDMPTFSIFLFFTESFLTQFTVIICSDKSLAPEI